MCKLERCQGAYESLRLSLTTPLKWKRLRVAHWWKEKLTLRYDCSENEYIIVPIASCRDNCY